MVNGTRLRFTNTIGKRLTLYFDSGLGLDCVNVKRAYVREDICSLCLFQTRR